MKKLYLIGIVFLLFTVGCEKENERRTVAGCDTTNTVFNQLYNNVLNTSPNVEEVTMDTVVHSYTFEVTSPETICKIGYRSQPTFEAFPYVIEIYNNTTGTMVYTGSHTFSSTSTEYVSITPVVLTVGDSYTINRIQNNYTGDISIFIGRAVLTHVSPYVLNFPFTMGDLKITGSSFGLATSSTAGTNTHLLPYIDIVFE